jgi:hypothetical protein
MRRTAVILQSNYIPWKGYFDLIRQADVLVVLDDAQFTKNDWRNRNTLRTAAGTAWLTIPVRTAGRFGQAIDEVEIADPSWASRHWDTWRQNYRRTPGFAVHEGAVRAMYEDAAREPLLSGVNRRFIDGVCGLLGIVRETRVARGLGVGGSGYRRVIGICEAVGADRYLSGPAGADYIDPAAFAQAGIALDYMDYQGYRPYPQPHPGFVAGVSILDTLFCTGLDAPAYAFRTTGAAAPGDRGV